jgi:3D (Asp-Asp-Asp) domain-containing protein
MTLHVSSKLFVIVLVVAALITAFRAPTKPINILAWPSVTLAERVSVMIEPQVKIVAARSIPVPKPLVELIPEIPVPDIYLTMAQVIPVPEVQVAIVVLEPPVAPEPVAETPDVVETTIAETPEVTLAAEVPTYMLKSTAYNSEVGQTDSNPTITATGATTAFGVIAVSPDMLGSIPYGSLVRLKDLGSYRSGRGEGKFQDVLDSQDLFIVEDTMHPRKVEQIDVWFADRSEALSWGVRKVELEVVRLGRDGPMLEPTLVATQ